VKDKNMDKIKLYNPYHYKKARKELDIPSIINGRMSMQSTARELESRFNIDAKSVLSPATLNKYKNWPVEKQDLFISIIGGIYQEQTKNYLNKLIK